MSDSTPISAAAIDRENPWPGLASFTEDARAFFFGREKETDELVRLVRRNTLTVLFGQSGLGKSSLLQAGAFPLLREADYLPLYLRLDHGIDVARVSRPSSEHGQDAHATLADQVKLALVEAFKSVGADAPAPRPDESLWEYFHRKDIDIWSAKNRLLTPILAFDQFEEIFTLGRATDAQRERGRAFLAELADLVENRPPAALRAKFDAGELDPARYAFDKPSCQVILSLREDFLPDLEGLKNEMRSIMQSRMRVRRLNGTQALEIVTRPAPHLLAEGVAERIVEFVAGARGGSAERLTELEVEPALLSVICRELNERRRTLGQPQISADLVSGNRREILTDFYERSVADLPEAMRTFVEDRLLTKSGFRDNLALETALEFPGVTRPLIDTLVARRLVRLEDRLGVQRVELTHDVLAEVIRAARDTRQQRLALEEAEKQRRLALAAASRRTRKQRLIIGGLTTAVVALCIGAVFGLRAQRRAEQFARDEAAQSSRTDFAFGSRMLEDERTPEGLAFLVRAARSDPANPAVGPRLMSALAFRNFAEPMGEPLVPTGVRAAGYLPDGRHAWTADDDMVRYWDLDRGRLEQSFRPLGRLTAHRPSSDGTRTAFAFSDDSVAVWDYATGRQVLGPLKHDARIYGLAWSADNRWLATVTNEQKTRIWDAATGEVKTVLETASPVGTTAFSPDGRVLVTAGGPSWQSWRVPGGEPLIPPVNHGASTFVHAFSPDGSLVAITGFGFIQLYHPSTGQPVGSRMTHPGSVSQSAFSPDGKMLATTSSDATARLWEVPSGRALFTLVHGADTNRPRFTPDGRLLLVQSADGSARIWNTQTGRLAFEPIRAGDVVQTDLRPDGSELMTLGRDGVLRRWRLTPSAVRPFELPPDANRLVVARSGKGDAEAWAIYVDRIEKIDLSTGRLAGPPQRFPTRITAPLLAPDERHFAVRTEAGEFEIWNLRQTEITRRALGRFQSGAETVRRFSGDSSHLAQNSPQGVRVWNTLTGALVAGPLGNLFVHRSSRDPFSPDNRRLLLVRDDRYDLVVVYDLNARRPVGEPIQHENSVVAPTFSPDGRLIAVLSRGVGQLWDANTLKPVGPPMPHRDETMRGVQFARDGRRLLTYGRQTARIWDVATSQPLMEPIAGGPDISPAAFSDDETRIMTAASGQGRFRMWDSQSGQLVSEAMATRTSTPADQTTFRASERIVAFGFGGNLTVWPAPPASDGKPVPEWLLRLATALAGGELDRRGNFRERPFQTKVFDEIRRTLAALPEDAPYAEWGRWFLADRAARAIGPGLKLTAEEAEKLRAGAGR